MANSRQSATIFSPSSKRPTKRTRSSITEHSFQGIASSPRGGSVTYVSGTNCHPCVRPPINHLRSPHCCAVSLNVSELSVFSRLLLYQFLSDLSESLDGNWPRATEVEVGRVRFAQAALKSRLHQATEPGKSAPQSTGSAAARSQRWPAEAAKR